jgi:hypothetical protein
MQNARQLGLLLQFFEGGAYACGTHTYAGGGFADALHIDSGALYERLLAQLLHGEFLSVVSGNHSQARGAAVHTVQLFIEGEFHSRLVLLILKLLAIVATLSTHQGAEIFLSVVVCLVIAVIEYIQHQVFAQEG